MISRTITECLAKPDVLLEYLFKNFRRCAQVHCHIVKKNNPHPTSTSTWSYYRVDETESTCMSLSTIILPSAIPPTCSIVKQLCSAQCRAYFANFKTFPPHVPHCNSNRPYFSHQVSLDSRLWSSCRAFLVARTVVRRIRVDIGLNLTPPLYISQPVI